MPNTADPRQLQLTQCGSHRWEKGLKVPNGDREQKGSEIEEIGGAARGRRGGQGSAWPQTRHPPQPIEMTIPKGVATLESPRWSRGKM